MSKRARKYQGVTAYVGMPGSGKTYSLAQVGQRAMARGERVVCNSGFDLEGAEVIKTFDEFAELEGPAVVVWDELPLYFNSRKWQEFPDSMLYKFTQIRKDGLRLYYSAIHEMMIDTNIRRITFWYWHCRAITGRSLSRSLYPPEEWRKAGQRPKRREFYFVRESVAAAYDTSRKVALPQKVRDKIAQGVKEAAPWDSLEASESGSAGALAPAPASVVPSVLSPPDPPTRLLSPSEAAGGALAGPSWLDGGYEPLEPSDASMWD